jgi:hypothetical protein
MKIILMTVLCDRTEQDRRGIGRCVFDLESSSVKSSQKVVHSSRRANVVKAGRVDLGRNLAKLFFRNSPTKVNLQFIKPPPP